MTLLSSVGAVEESPVDRWLADQADLSAVERFAQHHDALTGPVQERFYRDLMPAAAPGPGQQLAFAVDLDSCTGCKACVVACHSLNGLDDGEAFRRVDTVSGMRDGTAFQQTITAACHHCVDPACMNGCPVDAYEKDPVTGIVRHLDDQCIGCSYCTLTCPYEVPTFNKRLGIVRKCDMCADRLVDGEAPACVQSCPNQAIAITIVDVAAIVAATQGDAVLTPGAAPSRLTSPTTTYTTAKTPVTTAASHAPRGHGHPPLAAMLVLTQLAVGAFVVELFRGGARAVDASVSLAVASLAMAASVLHLGRPLYAYRAVIGIGHSWLSREIVAFGAFMGLAVPYALSIWFDRPVRVLGLAAGVAGVAGVVCSIMIYATTRRSSWTFARVTARFAGGGVVAGVATVAWVDALRGPWMRLAALTLVLAGLVGLQMWERLRFFTKASRPR